MLSARDSNTGLNLEVAEPPVGGDSRMVERWRHTTLNGMAWRPGKGSAGGRPVYLKGAVAVFGAPGVTDARSETESCLHISICEPDA
jgi:hypothetical protein